MTPTVSNLNSTMRYGAITRTVSGYGVGEQYFRVHAVRMTAGHPFDARAVRDATQVVVIDENTQKALFANQRDVLGRVILIGSVPVRVIGVASSDQPFLSFGTLNVWMPYTTIMYRLTGQSFIEGLTVRFKDGVPMAAGKDAVERVLKLRHRSKDFFIDDLEAMRRRAEASTIAMRMLVSAIAAISLVVGGIGIMNITLVSVTERTREIGVRMAIGARPSDICNQFLVEAMLVCLAGGFAGVVLAFCIGTAATQFLPFKMIFSLDAIVTAFGCSTAIGLMFGYLPARSAARLDPVAALARE